MAVLLIDLHFVYAFIEADIFGKTTLNEGKSKYCTATFILTRGYCHFLPQNDVRLLLNNRHRNRLCGWSPCRDIQTLKG